MSPGTPFEQPAGVTLSCCPKLHGFRGPLSDVWFLAMEYVADYLTLGSDSAADTLERAAAGPIDRSQRERCLSAFQQLASGISALHAAHVLQRDLVVHAISSGCRNVTRDLTLCPTRSRCRSLTGAVKRTPHRSKLFLES